MPGISTSTTSPSFMFSVAPSVPIHSTSPGYSVRSGAGDDRRAHRLERVRVLAPPDRSVPALPGALADVVADRVAEDAIERLGFRHALATLADHRHQLPFVLDLVRRVLGD